MTMGLRLTSITGILVGFFFVAGFAILFLLNPQTYDELNNLSIAAYNIPGMNPTGASLPHAREQARDLCPS